MKLSIAVPSFNYGRFLRHCLESIAAQKHADFEVLIADGGSKDASLDIIRDFCRRDPRFRLVSTSDTGQSDGVDRALAQASGEILGFLNADDFLIGDDALSTFVEAFAAHPEVDVVTCAGSYADESGRLTRPVRLRYHPLDSLALMKFRASVLQPATYWRRRVGEAIRFRPEFHFVFDAVFFFEAYQRFAWLELPKAVAGYRLHGANKSTAVRPDRIAELARYEQIKFGERSLRAAYLRLICLVVRTCERVPLLGGALKRGVYLAANSLAYATVYRLPGI